MIAGCYSIGVDDLELLDLYGLFMNVTTAFMIITDKSTFPNIAISTHLRRVAEDKVFHQNTNFQVSAHQQSLS